MLLSSYDHSFIVQATDITIINYNHKTLQCWPQGYPLGRDKIANEFNTPTPYVTFLLHNPTPPGGPGRALFLFRLDWSCVVRAYREQSPLEDRAKG